MLISPIVLFHAIAVGFTFGGTVGSYGKPSCLAWACITLGLVLTPYVVRVLS